MKSAVRRRVGGPYGGGITANNRLKGTLKGGSVVQGGDQEPQEKQL